MASLNTGSAQVTQRVNPGLVDPRLLGADLSRIGQGIGQGMGLVNDYYSAKENAAMRPVRRGLADLQLAAAQEQAAGAENRRALADLNFQLAKGQVDMLPSQKTLRDIQLAAAQRQAEIDANTVVRLDTLGKYEEGGERKGGYWSAPDNREVPVTYTPQESGVLETVRLGSGEIVTRKRPDSVILGKDVAIAAVDRAGKAANEAARLQILQDNVAVEREKLEAQVAKMNAGGKKNHSVQRLTTRSGGVAIGILNEDTGEWVSPPKVIPGAATVDPIGGLINANSGTPDAQLPAYSIPVMPQVAAPTVAPDAEGGIFSWFGGDDESAGTPAVNPVTAPFTGAGPAANPANAPSPAPAAAVPTDADVSAAQKRINELKGEKGIVSLEGSPLAGLVRKPTVASDTPRVAAPDARTQSYIKANEARKVKGAEKTLADIELLLEQGGKIRMDRNGRKTVVPLSEKEAMELEKDRLSAIKILGLDAATDTLGPAPAVAPAPVAEAASSQIMASPYGYAVRNPYKSEDVWFALNPKVAGMASEDGRIVLNPYSGLSDENKAAVAKNEAIRLFMRENNVDPQFKVTPEQMKSFAGTEYGKKGNEVFMRQTLVSRILTGDPSAANATEEQRKAAQSIMQQITKRRPRSLSGVSLE